ncbi:transcription factor SPN1 [Nematocida homosporus]|uniref:transcription factor SPN1 n=1 Tax=Nematocida homosporus TaxID=1912981 RepID=UPI00221F0B13|nr:transcription factor SPN1 [Nematocida homosporus]KAI5185888.1 transcription factor SPN1 [Nematocida homosporus]
MSSTDANPPIVYDNKEIGEILVELDKAQKEDEQLNQEGKPALTRLFLMDSIYNKLLNKKIHEELLDSGVLSLLKKWLEPLPDNSLPHNDVKKGVFDILQHFTPEKEHLIESGIGKIVLFYSKNPYEKKEIKRMAKQLVLRWIELATSQEE